MTLAVKDTLDDRVLETETVSEVVTESLAEALTSLLLDKSSSRINLSIHIISI
jgi:hypothetical protein